MLLKGRLSLERLTSATGARHFNQIVSSRAELICVIVSNHARACGEGKGSEGNRLEARAKTTTKIEVTMTVPIPNEIIQDPKLSGAANRRRWRRSIVVLLTYASETGAARDEEWPREKQI